MQPDDFVDIKRFPQIRFERRDFIIRQGDPIKSVYFLISGVCNRSVITTQGDEIVYDVRKGDWSVKSFLGALAIYRPEHTHPSNFITQTECYCYKIDKDLFHDYLIAHPLVMDELFTMIMDRYAILDRSFQFKRERNAPGQVCSLLVANLNCDEQGCFVDANLNNSAISRLVGMHRTTVVRIVQALVKQGVLERTNARLQVIDAETLIAYANEEKKLDYYCARK